MAAAARCRPRAGSAAPPARIVVVVVIVTAVLAGAVPAVAAPAPTVAYAPPVDGPVLDPYRAPPTPFAAGNRGVDLGTTPGEAVRAAADGVVTFAGRVGHHIHVVVLHADGIRTTYAFLASASVARGQHVARGQAVGTAGDSLHFGARAGDEYLDPSLLFSGGEVQVHLVPHGARRPAPVEEERRGLLAWLGDRAWALGGAVVGGGADVADWLAGAAVDTAQVAREHWPLLLSLVEKRIGLPIGASIEFGLNVVEWFEDQDSCTPTHVVTPELGERRIAVLVGGFGSSSDRAAIRELDTEGLGYDVDDVVQFSYGGGKVHGFGGLDVASTTYDRHDTYVDIRVSGRELRHLLQSIAALHPGVPVDLIAHSQGGLVARSALAGDGTPRLPGDLPEIRNVVTLGTPHQGSDVATAVAALDRQAGAGHVLRLLGDVVGMPPGAPSAAQMAKGSDFLTDLAGREPDRRARYTSISARNDLVVAAPRTLLDGATNVVLPLAVNAHDALPGSELAHREVALAVNGYGPTCRRLLDLAVDAVVSTAIGAAIDAIGTDVAMGAFRLHAALRLAGVPAPSEGDRP